MSVYMDRVRHDREDARRDPEFITKLAERVLPKGRPFTRILGIGIAEEEYDRIERLAAEGSTGSLDASIRLMADVSARLGSEFGGHLLSHYLRAGGSLPKIVNVARGLRADPQVRPFLAALKDALTPTS